MTDTELKKQVEKALASYPSLPQPTIKITSLSIVMTLTGEHAAVANVGPLVDALQRKEINYLDPTPGTNDVSILVDNDQRGTPRKVVVSVDRMNKEEYNKALDVMAKAQANNN